MGQHVHTKLHILCNNVDPRTGNRGTQTAIIQKMLAAASFVVDDEVVALLRREDAAKSIMAIIEAKVARLPFNPMVVEFEVSKQFREFVLLREEDDKFFAHYTVLEKATDVAMVTDWEVNAVLQSDKVILHNVPGEKDLGETIATGVSTGLMIALLMLNTKGIEKEVVEVAPSLNAKRQKSGKPPIPRHSVVHIGTIYDRHGTAIKRDGAGGWHMPVHWRCGHTRMQRYGKGWTEERLIYVPPCLVNFKPDDSLPTAPKKEVRV